MKSLFIFACLALYFTLVFGDISAEIALILALQRAICGIVSAMIWHCIALLAAALRMDAR